jgi:Ca2+-transporting ATPase
MERAFHELASRAGLAAPPDGWRLVHEYPLSDRLLAVTQAWKPSDSELLVVATKGAPEAVARLCGFDDTRMEAIAARVASMASRGLRVLGVAQCRKVPTALPDSPLDFRFTWLGLIGLSDPVRPNVPAAIRECRSGGIRVVMITGDHAATALAIGRQIGLAPDGTYLTGSELGALSDDELRERVANVEVFARIVPEQKLRLVTALQARGEVVGMTGDGVNDAPALKAADIGIAMGERGTDVAREAAALVLTDDDFSSIVRAIALGRRIYDNIAKAMSYVLAIHVPIALVSMVPVLAGGPMVLLPLHIILMELIVDPACSVAFEMEPADDDIMRRRPRPPRQRLFTPRYVVRSLTQGACAGVAALIVYFVSLRSGYGELDVRTLTFATLIVTNLSLILTSRALHRPLIQTLRTPNRALWLLMGSALATLVFVIAVPPLRELFRLAPVHVDDLLLIVVVAAAALLMMEGVKRI